MRPDQKSRQKNKSGIAVPVSTLSAGTILDIFCAAMDWQNKWLKSAVLGSIIVLLICYWGLYSAAYMIKENEIRKNHERKIARLDSCRDSSDDLESFKRIVKQKENENESYEINRTTLKKRVRRVSLVSGTEIVMAAVILVFLWVPALQETEGAKNNDPVYNGESTPALEQGTVTREDVSGKSDEGAPTPEQLAEMKGKTFLLEEPGRSLFLTDEQESRVFYVTGTDREICKKEVDRHLSNLRGIGRESTLNLASQIEKNVIAQASGNEDYFRRDIKKAMEYRQKEDYTGWLYSIPSSGTLERDIMAMREQFWTVGEGEIVKFDSSLCFMMANSNQLLAMEYDLQGGIPETVIYYYTESIIWVEEALTYRDLPKETAVSYEDYIKGRYKDNSDFIENNLNGFMDQEDALELKEKAWAVYRAM